MDPRNSRQLHDHAARSEQAGNTYRPDIDGLRAVAIVSVLLYHAGLAIFSGGFVGVDVFFVISGFLITAILAGEIARGHFSILAFYERRVRRIFPALFVVLLFSALMGCLLFPDRKLKDLSDGLIATVLFASNVLFWWRYGYFNQNASTQPVIHTWSLAVEEQFYIFFPILLFALSHWLPRRVLIISLVVLALLSLTASAWWVYRFPRADFYLTPFRAWELLLGSLIALRAFPPIRAQWLREVAALAGLGLILWAVFLFTPQTVFPGLNALFPCVGTALIIHSGGDGSSRVGKWLSLRPVVFVGLISYSLYLWHWPLFVFAESWNLGDLNGTLTYMVVALSFVLAVLTWRYIENPFRRKRVFLERTVLFRAAALAMFVGLMIGGAGHASLGWKERLPQEALRLEKAEGDSNSRRGQCHNRDGHVTLYEEKCVYGAPDIVPQYAIWGDSHAVELVTGLGEIAGEHGQAILQISYSDCPPSFGEEALSGVRCRNHNNAVFRKLVADSSKKLIFLNSRYREKLSEDGFRAVVEGLLAAGKRIAIIYPFPSADGSVPILLTSAVMRGRDPEALSISYPKYRMENTRAFAFLDSLPRGKDIVRVYPDKFLCTNADCAIIKNGTPLYFDSNHISVAGAKYLEPLFSPIFDKLVP